MKSHVSAEIIVPVNVAHAWEYYYNQINAWFDKTFWTSERTRRFIFETYLGGRAFEDFGEGDGLLWGTVIGAEYHSSVDLQGFLAPRYGGPAVTFERWHFESIDEGTRVSYTMDAAGELDQKTIQSLAEGWQSILSAYHKYCLRRKNE